MKCKLCKGSGSVFVPSLQWKGAECLVPCPNGCKSKDPFEGMDYEQVLQAIGGRWQGQSQVMPHQRNGRTLLVGE